MEAASMEILFTVLPNQGDWSGFELGDIRLMGRGFEVSSAGHSPSQSMMIFIALADLLEGIAQLSKQKNGGFAFVGTDSSFSLHFRKRSERLEIIYDNGSHTTTFAWFHQKLMAVGEQFYRAHVDQVGRYSAAMSDLSPFFED